MLKNNFRKNYTNIIAIMSLIVAALGFAGLTFTHQSAQAQQDEALYLPVVLHHGFTRPVESLMILTPGSASTITNPVHVAGISDPTFEQSLVVRVLLADGTVVAEEPTTIQAEIGERGPYELDLDLDLDTEENIFIQVYATSARDGGIIHLSSVGVFFTPTGPEDIISRDPYPEQIMIFQPQNADTISCGIVSVEGFGLASFEQTLVIDVLDEMGDVIATEAVIVEAPDLGFPGLYSAEIEYTVSEPGPGRIVVRDVSPAHGDNVHLNSVEVTLQP